MFSRTRRVIGLLLLALLCTCPPPATGRAPVPKARPGEVRTYRFTARVTDNGGVLPFRSGEAIEGSFTYDRGAEPQHTTHPSHGAYDSPRDDLRFRLGGLHFRAAGGTRVTIGALGHAEHFQVVAFDLALPEGWGMDHTGRSQSYGIILQNVPARGVISGTGIPDRVKLADFTSSRELRLDFFHGVRFPGGQVNRRATVYATVEAIQEE